MQRVFRLSLVGILGIASLTACGDKITETGGGNVVHSVTVSPPSANMNVGDKVTFAASVDAEAGVTNRTVTWSSSNTAVATVDAATGAATAVAAGTASIIAKSVADPTVQGAAVVTVAAGVPATVTLGQINTTVCSTITGTCSSVPATLNNIANQLDVTLNVDAGTQKLAGVDLIMNCGGADTVVVSQNLASADLAPLSAEEATAPVTLSFNTAAFNPLTGLPAFKNGQCTLKARARLQNGTQVASSSQTITLNNVDFVSATMTTTPATGQVASATDNKGLVWRAGAVNVTVVPVFFSAGTSVGSATVSLINADDSVATKGAPGSVAAGGTVATLSGLTPTAGVITATFPKDMSAAGVDSTTVKFLSVRVTTVGSTGNPGPILNPDTLKNFIRLDNRPPNPAPVVFLANTQNTSGGWIGANFDFTKAIIAVVGPDTVSLNTLDDNGVDNIKLTTQSATGSTFTTFTSIASLGETASGSALKLRVQVCDALGNCANAGSSTTPLTLFGVDLTPPSFSTSGISDKKVFNMASTLPSTITVAVTDTSPTSGATPSGGAGVLVRLQALKPSGSSSSATTCVMPVNANGACTADTLVSPTFNLPAGGLASGEYTLTVTAVDAAGNKGTPVTIRYYIDLAAPVVSGGVSVPASITTGTSFASNATDNMDVAAGNGVLNYAAAKFFETGTATPTGVTFDNALTRAAAITVTLNTFYRGLSTAAGTAGTAPTTVGIRAIDAAGNLSASQAVALPAANMSTPGTIPNTGATGITAFALTIDSATVAATHKVVLTSTLTPVDPVNGGTPFNQVCFYYAEPSGAENNAAGPDGAATGELIKIGCTSALTTVVVGGNRTLVYSFTWTVPAALASTSLNIYMVGNNANLDALISSATALTVGAVPTP